MPIREELISHMARSMTDHINSLLATPEFSGFTCEDMSAALVVIIAAVIPEDKRNPEGLAIYLYSMKRALEARLNIKSDDYACLRKS